MTIAIVREHDGDRLEINLDRTLFPFDKFRHSLAPFETLFDFVKEANAFFAESPAEAHIMPTMATHKIDQAASCIFQLGADALQLIKQRRETRLLSRDFSFTDNPLFARHSLELLLR